MNIINPEITKGTTESLREKWWVWVLAVIAALIVIWLGASWLRGWFPFAPPISEQQRILNSLTVPVGPAIQVSQSVINSLTVASSSKSKAVKVPQSVINSLTVPAK